MAESIYWVDPDGGCLKLFDSTACTDTEHYTILDGTEGLFMPDFDFTTERVYSLDGELIRGVSTKPRKVVMPLMVRGSTSTEFMQNLRTLLYAMNPKRGFGHIKVYTVDGKTRALPCRFLESPIVDSASTGKYTASTVASKEWRKFPITLYVPNPYWYDLSEKEVKVSYTSLGYPLKLTNDGDTLAYPIWSIGGPMNFVEVYNETTGKLIYLTLTMASYDTLYIDTRPLMKGILLNHSTNEFAKLSTDSTLYPFVPGANKINITMSAATTYSEIRVRWIEYYLGV